MGQIDTVAVAREGPLTLTRYAFVFMTLLLAAPADAAPITTNLTGHCVESLPTTGATWQSTSHFRFAVFWDDALDCEATIANGYGPYIRFDNFDGLSGLRIEIPGDALYSCKKHQIDWQEVLADGSLGLLGAIIINPGLNGGCAGGMSPPRITTTSELPAKAVPETGTGVTMLIAAGVMAIRRRVMLPQGSVSPEFDPLTAPAGCPCATRRRRMPPGCYAVTRMLSRRNSGAMSAPLAHTNVWNSG